MKRHVFHPEADEEYTRAALYYRGINPELGNRFFEEIGGLSFVGRTLLKFSL